MFPTSAKSGEGISSALAWLLVDPPEALPKKARTTIGPGFTDYQEQQRNNTRNERSDSCEIATSFYPYDPAPCKFCLIPNDMSLDQFNFEERERKRLVNPFNSISGINCGEALEGVSMIIVDTDFDSNTHKSNT